MRVALISEHASPLAGVGGAISGGGQNVYISQLAKHLAHLGVSVDIFTRRDSSSLQTVVRLAEEIRVIHISAGPETEIYKDKLLPYMDEFLGGMLQYTDCCYDIIHANYWLSGIVGLRLRELWDAPLTVTFHSLGKIRRAHLQAADLSPDTRFEVEELIVSEADCLIAESPDEQQNLLSLYGAKLEKITVIPCGVDTSEFTPMKKEDARRALNVSPNTFVILFVGRIVPTKGIANVIQSLSHLRKLGIEALLLIVGGESDEPNPNVTPEILRLTRIAQSEGVLDLIRFEGRRDRKSLRYLYFASDIFVSTPWYETFGLTILEAMACGIPVIGSNVGGIRYSVLPGKTGYLVAPDDSHSLAERIKELYSNPTLREQMGIHARARAYSDYPWSKTASQTLEAYTKLSNSIEPPLLSTGQACGEMRG
jgi:D-inositol-3-phosphate glycosyltransferase